MNINEKDRRPIAARNHQLSQKIAHFLAQHNVSPNTISVGGLVAGLLAGASAAATSHWPEMQPLLFPAAATLILVRLLANMFDGMVAVIARRPNPLGELYNDIPDRISDTATLIGIGYAIHSSPVAGYWAAVLAMLTAYVRAVGKASGAPSEFCGPMAKQQRMFLSIAVLVISGLIPDKVATLIPGCPFSGEKPISLITTSLWVIAAGSA